MLDFFNFQFFAFLPIFPVRAIPFFFKINSLLNSEQNALKLKNSCVPEKNGITFCKDFLLTFDKTPEENEFARGA